uniref:Uncharacterized protein n=1 Tax=Glossina austeni TaxID=7395 RepID=A0A1A9UR26_GLOAU
YALLFTYIQFGLLQIIQQTKLNASCIYQEHCQQMLQIDLNQNKTKINNPQYIRRGTGSYASHSMQYQLMQYPSIENLEIVERIAFTKQVRAYTTSTHKTGHRTFKINFFFTIINLRNCKSIQLKTRIFMLIYHYQSII